MFSSPIPNKCILHFKAVGTIKAVGLVSSQAWSFLSNVLTFRPRGKILSNVQCCEWLWGRIEGRTLPPQPFEIIPYAKDRACSCIWPISSLLTSMQEDKLMLSHKIILLRQRNKSNLAILMHDCTSQRSCSFGPIVVGRSYSNAAFHAQILESRILDGISTASFLSKIWACFFAVVKF